MWPGPKAFKGEGDQKGKALGTRLGEFKADMVGRGKERGKAAGEGNATSNPTS